MDKFLLKEKVKASQDKTRLSLDLLNKMHVDKFTFIGSISDDITADATNADAVSTVPKDKDEEDFFGFLAKK